MFLSLPWPNALLLTVFLNLPSKNTAMCDVFNDMGQTKSEVFLQLDRTMVLETRGTVGFFDELTRVAALGGKPSCNAGCSLHAATVSAVVCSQKHWSVCSLFVPKIRMNMKHQPSRLHTEQFPRNVLIRAPRRCMRHTYVSEPRICCNFVMS